MKKNEALNFLVLEWKIVMHGMSSNNYFTISSFGINLFEFMLYVLNKKYQIPTENGMKVFFVKATFVNAVIFVCHFFIYGISKETFKRLFH